MPLLSAHCPEHGCNDPGWAAGILQAFCSSPAAVQAAVLELHAGDADLHEGDAELLHAGDADLHGGDAAADEAERTTATGARGAHHAAGLLREARREVELCSKLPWRLVHAEVSDSALLRCCLVMALNGYSYHSYHSYSRPGAAGAEGGALTAPKKKKQQPGAEGSTVAGTRADQMHMAVYELVHIYTYVHIYICIYTYACTRGRYSCGSYGRV